MKNFFLLVAFFVCSSFLSAQTPAVETTPVLAADKIIFPAADPVSAPISAAPTSAASMAGTTFVYLVFLAALGYTSYILWRRKAVPGGGVKSTAATLQITNTRALGSRQYLVVLKYRGQELLLGVGPGFITKLDSVKDSVCDTSSQQ